MPSEDDLRAQLRDERPGGQIDLDAVVRRARARRRPRVAAAAIVSSLAVLGVVVPVSISLASTHTTSSLSAGSAASRPDSLTAPEAQQGGDASGSGSSGIKRAPADKINLCTGTLATPAPAEDGLVLTVQPVDTSASARDIPVIVTLTNTGARQVTGSLSPFPALTLSRDGIVLWHSNGAVPSLAQEIALAPGASTTFTTTFEPVRCGVADDEQPSFRDDLPAVGAGRYQLSAALDVTPDVPGTDGQISAVLVTGPTSLVTLH